MSIGGSGWRWWWWWYLEVTLLNELCHLPAVHWMCWVPSILEHLPCWSLCLECSWLLFMSWFQASHFMENRVSAESIEGSFRPQRVVLLRTSRDVWASNRHSGNKAIFSVWNMVVQRQKASNYLDKLGITYRWRLYTTVVPGSENDTWTQEIQDEESKVN